mgnify:CR=1 FL=1
MEIFNNIWTALSTPNEGLIKLLCIPLTFIESILVMNLFMYILNIKATKNKKIIYIILSSITSLITTNFIVSPFNTIANYLILFFIIYFIFKPNIIKTILAILIPTIVFALISSLLLNPFIKINNIDYNATLTIPVYRLEYLFIVYIIILSLLLIIKNKNIYLNVLDEFDTKTKLTLIFTFILGLFVLCVNLFVTAYYTNELPIIISVLNFMCLLAYFGINIYTLTRITKLISTKKQLANAEEYNNTLQIIHDSVRCFKHDFDNTVATLGGYIQTNDMEGLKNYYKQLENECEKVNNLYILNPEIINNPGIYSLLTNKYHKAEKQDVKLNISVLMDLNTINMKIYDFTKILGILLDNSIDAASTCEEKIVNVIFREDDKNKRQLLIIENTYLDKNVDINKIFDKGFTGKENHTGLGLWEIRKILKRNNNLNLHTTKTDKYFTQQFEIYNI